MNIRRILTVALMISAGVIGTVSLAHGVRSAHAQDGPGEGRWHQGHRRHGGGLMHLCKGGDLNANLDRMTERLKAELELSTAQMQNLDAIAQSLKSSDLATACATAEETPPATALDKLNRMEEKLETGLNTVKQIRPSFETFYSSLSTDQQTELDTLMSRRHRR